MVLPFLTEYNGWLGKPAGDSFDPKKTSQLPLVVALFVYPSNPLYSILAKPLFSDNSNIYFFPLFCLLRFVLPFCSVISLFLSSWLKLSLVLGLIFSLSA